MDTLTSRASREILPAEAPLAMPVQDLARAPPSHKHPPAPQLMWLRRLLVVGGALALTVAGA